MEVSGQIHVPAALTPVCEALRAPVPVWTLWRREKPNTEGTELGPSGPLPVVVPTELSRRLCSYKTIN
jgi:hypothetical protein